MHQRRVFISAALMTAAAIPAAHAQLVTNGSLTGAPGEGFAPPAWTTGTQGADTVAPGGLASPSGPGGFHAYQMPASPDGGTFVSLYGSPSVVEHIQQSVSGLTVGQTYRVSFFYGLGGWWQGSSIYPDETAPGFLNVSFGGGTQSTPVISFDGFGSQQWYTASMDFTATSTTSLLHIAGASNTGITRLAIDGIAVNPVPAPSALALLAVIPLASRRRR